MPRWFYVLLIFSIAAPVLAVFHAPPLLLFPIAGLGILPLAALIGTSVEHIAEHTGEQVGGILFATFGNATELIIGIFALSQGLVDVVSASIIGSILGNALLVLGSPSVWVVSNMGAYNLRHVLPASMPRFWPCVSVA